MLGYSLDDIGKQLGVTRQTVAKYFPEELKKASQHLLREGVELLRRSAKKGNVSAQKQLVAIASGIVGGQSMEKWQQEAAAPGKAPGAKLGKKEQAQLDAKKAGEGTEWGEDLGFEGGLPN